MNLIPESKKSHVWHKVVWHTDPEEFPLGPMHSVEIYCCEEANGFSIWYVRRLAKDDSRGNKGMDNGDYLLNYFSKHGRDLAIERAVLIANAGSNPDEIIRGLDTAAAAAQKV